MRYTQELISQKHEKAFAYYWDSPNREWLKIGTYFSPGGTILEEKHLRVEMGQVTLAEAFSHPGTGCYTASDTMRVYLNGEYIGQTNYIYKLFTDSYGVASDHPEADEDSCGQPASNIVQGYDGRHLFSYRHDDAGMNASRCLFECWQGDGSGYYDGFVWGVR